MVNASMGVDGRALPGFVLRIPEVVEFIKFSYFATSDVPDRRFPIVVLGPPGIGKTEAVRTAAEHIASTLGKEFIEYDDSQYGRIMESPSKYFVYVYMRLTEIERGDLLGIPRDSGDAVFYKPLGWAKVLSVADGVLFLDELTQVQSDDVFAAALRVLDGAAGFTRFSRGTLIVAAGNTPEDSPIARMLPTNMVNRFVVIRAAPATVEEWARYMDSKYGDAWDRSIYAYLVYNTNDFFEKLDPQGLERLDNYATPRTYTIASLLLHRLRRGGNEKFMKTILIGTLGPTIGTKVYAFVSKDIDVVAVLHEPSKFAKYSLDDKLFIIWGAANLYNKAVRTGDKPLAKLVADFVEDAVIKRKPEHWRELIILFTIALEKGADGGASPRRRFIDEVLSKYDDVIASIEKVVELRRGLSNAKPTAG